MRPEGGWRPRQIAVVDIGSNSVRLVIYRLEGRALWTVFNEKVLAGLGRDLSRTGRLSEEGVQMARTALRRFAMVIDGVAPDHAFVFATAAVRDAADGPDFCAAVSQETDFNIRVLSGAEEARYAALGVLAGAPDSVGVAADLGGASLELTRIDAASSEPVGVGVTLPLGPFALGAPNGFDERLLRQTIAQRLAPVASAYSAPLLHAVGGAWRSLAQVHMARTDYPLHVVHQYAMTADEARDVARHVISQPRKTLDKLPGLTRKRAETISYAALVLDGAIEHLGLEGVVFSAWGVREGLLFERMAAETSTADPLLAGCSAIGRRQGISPGLPSALTEWIAPVADHLPSAFGPDRDQLLTASACRLADLGARLHPDHRIELVFDQVLRAPVAGQNHAERAFLACVVNARYGGDAATPEPSTVDLLLTAEARRRARALGLAIRLACDLSGRSPRLLSNASLSIETTKEGDLLKIVAADGYQDLLLGEQTRRRAAALATIMDLQLAL